jgi:hypothetical protein
MDPIRRHKAISRMLQKNIIDVVFEVADTDGEDAAIDVLADVQVTVAALIHRVNRRKRRLGADIKRRPS